MQWVDGNGQRVRALGRGKVQLVLTHAPGDVVISSNPRLHVPNFDRCRRDRFCRCAVCKPAYAHG